MQHKMLERQKNILLALSQVVYGYEKEIHKQIGGTDDDLALTYKAVNELCKKGYIQSMWKDKGIVLILKLNIN